VHWYCVRLLLKILVFYCLCDLLFLDIKIHSLIHIYFPHSYVDYSLSEITPAFSDKRGCMNTPATLENTKNSSIYGGGRVDSFLKISFLCSRLIRYVFCVSAQLCTGVIYSYLK
jgi:hypothetical protein